MTTRGRTGAGHRRVGRVPVLMFLAALGLGIQVVCGGVAQAEAHNGSVRVTPPNERVGSGNAALKTSLDWAGYVDTGTTFSSVAGSWTQPSATCPTNKPQQSAFWVGLDGYSGTPTTVEQIGTDADCVKAKHSSVGTPSYYAWYELFPLGLVPLPTGLYPVVPGDVLTGSVVVSGGSYVLSISDGAKWHFTTTQAPSSQPLDNSAEWIAEAPSTCKGTKCKVIQLADFGSVSFTGATADGQPVSSFATSEIEMTTKKAKSVKALPSALAGGTAFSVAWQGN